MEIAYKTRKVICTLMKVKLVKIQHFYAQNSKFFVDIEIEHKNGNKEYFYYLPMERLYLL